MRAKRLELIRRRHQILNLARLPFRHARTRLESNAPRRTAASGHPFIIRSAPEFVKALPAPPRAAPADFQPAEAVSVPARTTCPSVLTSPEHICYTGRGRARVEHFAKSARRLTGSYAIRDPKCDAARLHAKIPSQKSGAHRRRRSKAV